MKWLKICALLAAVLGAMRVGSWIIGWLVAKLAPARPGFAIVAANITAFVVFAFLLLRNQMPGEPADTSALVFGAAVFAVCCWTDFYWRPWRPRG